ncbi:MULTISPECIES: DinB family protein [Paenibacillus]|uniref:DinB family protein n=1 Tax=Paenibacillus TaxID=44249 RepID=UPI0022B8A9A2|nr:DinB family protein [Paenibacillus caseinilyticus]MCZ8520363.1 DinB family protein [Paenibacillus caseinilyticus]
MFQSIEAFKQTWTFENGSTQKLLDVLTNDSLKQQVTENHRTLGELAWHIVTTHHEMLSRTGLKFDAPAMDSPVPASAAEIAAAYRQSSQALLEALSAQWTDASLQESCDMYGEQWTNSQTLYAVTAHEIHHRGQMTILMRQAGLRVSGVYGPSLEEWESFAEGGVS